MVGGEGSTETGEGCLGSVAAGDCGLCGDFAIETGVEGYRGELSGCVEGLRVSERGSGAGRRGFGGGGRVEGSFGTFGGEYCSDS